MARRSGAAPPRSRTPPASQRSRRPSAGRASSTGSTAGPDERLARIEAVLASLTGELAELRRALEGASLRAAATASEPPSRSQRTAEPAEPPPQLHHTAELLAAALADVPRAADFQPFADHLYAFAQTTPALLESLQALPQAVGPLEARTRAIEAVSEVLQATCERWTESLLRLPQAEDYEPLVQPLREFAHVAPALAESLAGVMRSTAPLADAVAQLRAAADGLGAARAATDRPAHVDAPAIQASARRVAEAVAAIRGALATLPRDPEYSRVAAQLREIASVSPSLTEWLGEVPKLTRPLADSIASLEHAAELLDEAARALRAAGAPR
jgi:hypothetical protein